jgi:hypothetical protein
MGVTYNSTGPSKKPTVGEKMDEVTKYYTCGMVQDSPHGLWRQDQQERGTKTTIKEEDSKQQKKGSVKQEIKRPISSKIKCCGTLIAK